MLTSAGLGALIETQRKTKLKAEAQLCRLRVRTWCSLEMAPAAAPI